MVEIDEDEAALAEQRKKSAIVQGKILKMVTIISGVVFCLILIAVFIFAIKFSGELAP